MRGEVRHVHVNVKIEEGALYKQIAECQAFALF